MQALRDIQIEQLINEVHQLCHDTQHAYTKAPTNYASF
jgi:hypothetical protein